MKRVEIFSTQIDNELDAKQIFNVRSKSLPETIINFDLNDCDRILRVESALIDTEQIKQIMKSLGFPCELISGGGIP